MGVSFSITQRFGEIDNSQSVKAYKASIVLSEETDEEFHLKNFKDIASMLQGSTNRCYFKFVLHRKNLKDFNRLNEKNKSRIIINKIRLLNEALFYYEYFY